MGIPLSLVFFTLGAVLTFAVRSDPSGLDLDTVGVILMLVSLVGFAITFYQNQWRRRIVEESVEAGTPSPVSVDDTILVDPTSPYEAPRRREPGLTPEEDDKMNAKRHPELEPQEVVHVGSPEANPAQRRS
ncbi:hypothetical protein [Frankia sp. R82]|uniref:hypothetical protein n=1 Tax=Frankia sp. R82 TaxID=2950553 RepID=UPI002043B133|nr:hypothetical protein [Frankia sp. R82]MCM3883014.1 hypothetical protein [Frankia sp. R82]